MNRREGLFLLIEILKVNLQYDPRFKKSKYVIFRHVRPKPFWLEKHPAQISAGTNSIMTWTTFENQLLYHQQPPAGTG